MLLQQPTDAGHRYHSRHVGVLYCYCISIDWFLLYAEERGQLLHNNNPLLQFLCLNTVEGGDMLGHGAGRFGRHA